MYLNLQSHFFPTMWVSVSCILLEPTFVILLFSSVIFINLRYILMIYWYKSMLLTLKSLFCHITSSKTYFFNTFLRSRAPQAPRQNLPLLGLSRHSALWYLKDLVSTHWDALTCNLHALYKNGKHTFWTKSGRDTALLWDKIFFEIWVTQENLDKFLQFPQNFHFWWSRYINARF